MSIYTDKLKEKAEKLKGILFASSGIDGGEVCAAFVAVSSGEERAIVFRASGNAPADAFDEAVRKACRYINTNKLDPRWVKADISVNAEKISFKKVIETIAAGRSQFFRKGISFDDSFTRIISEGELNGKGLISYKNKTIELKSINSYLQKNDMPVLTSMPNELTIFDVVSAFCGDDKAYPLYGSGANCGRQIRRELTDKDAMEILQNAADYLANQIYPVGAFEYGYYPIPHHVIQGYNILRHASSIWSVLMNYRITQNDELRPVIDSVMGFLVRNMANRYSKPDSEYNTVFLIERNSSEIKLGGNGLAVIALTEYMDVFKCDKYQKLCIELGNGILEMRRKNGRYVHVLNYPDLTLKDKFRTVYYDGEATFALMRLYGLTRDEKWLNAARESIDMFIREGYEKYRDHWVAYSLNEFTKYVPEEKYFSFAMKNAMVNLRRIHDQDTTYHTYLELLGVSFETWLRMKELGIAAEYASDEEILQLIETIFHRADYMLNGCLTPELAMYLKYPVQISGAFCVRHDNFRIRIDDVQHNIGAYYSFYKNYPQLIRYRKELLEKAAVQ
ncbi:MAG: glycosyl hydrolase family 88 [Huintestinicola sp.]